MYSKITYIYMNTFFLVQIPRDLINVFMFFVNLHVVMEDNSAYSNFGLSTLFPLPFNTEPCSRMFLKNYFTLSLFICFRCIILNIYVII